MSGLIGKFARMKPFSGSRRESDEDKGEAIDVDSAAGGSRKSDVPKKELRVSEALKAFLVHENILTADEAGLNATAPTPALGALLEKPHAVVPPELLDLSHPLPEYYISSSHNTYLLAHQLYGDSCVSAYDIALKTGSRCVEIDAWDSDDPEEPKVTHGFTLVSNVPFRAVCETIRDAFDEEKAYAASHPGTFVAPILLSLENHCAPHGQLRLVQIMKEVFQDRLLSEAIRKEGHREQEGSGEHVTLWELGAAIAVIVEYHLPNEKDSDSDSTSSSDSSDDEVIEARHAYKDKKKAEAPTIIIPELAELGVYAQSVKPSDNSWFESDELVNGPHHHLINVSESTLASHLPEMNDAIARHNAKHLMRVFPKGLRISSSNLKPVRYWGVGAQICALNWQTFGASMQLNEALFHSSDGYILKPAALRAGGDGKLVYGRKKRLRLRAVGATDIPLHGDEKADDIRPYLTCSLYQPTQLDDDAVKRKTSPYKQRGLDFPYDGDAPPATDPVWNETLEWEYEDNELTFLRMILKSDKSLGSNPIFAVAAVRLLYVQPGWSFVRLLDLKGRETHSALLVRFDIDDV
ncbi:1-phosphatidylinositol 4,5-bisphosphate phosphodiesterase 1 [Paramyrothecium foliicola]|nr:1-phosphatidylinositol 4,5-bisphosphate phosphodiesterase 1 [Paramyrothecium foliicola]